MINVLKTRNCDCCSVAYVSFDCIMTLMHLNRKMIFIGKLGLKGVLQIFKYLFHVDKLNICIEQIEKYSTFYKVKTDITKLKKINIWTLIFILGDIQNIQF